MKSLSIFLLVLSIALGGCSRQKAEMRAPTNVAAPQQAGFVNSVAKEDAGKTKNSDTALTQLDKSVSNDAALDRKIVRDANLTIEVPSTRDAQQKVTSIAETHGGFVITSEAKQREHDDPAKRTVDVKLILRVPANQFNSTLEQITALATNMPESNVSGQDVTEEFIDLEARIKTQKALELQFLEIMKQAGKISDALEVQSQIADVRTNIEKLEGRKRFLESRSSLSTITVNIQTPVPIVVSASGFGHTVRGAVSESVEVASAIVLFFVRFVIVMVPVFVLLILPAGLLALYFRRRAHRIRLANALETSPVSD